MGDTVFSLFETIQSLGTLVLLSALLLVSLIIGWIQGRTITSLKNYLYSPGEMKAWEFGLSETAYMIAVGTTLVFLSFLTVDYGSFFLIVVVISWLLSLFVYSKLALGGDLIEFFRNKGAHLGDYIIGDDSEKPRTRTETLLISTISIIIGVTFFGYYFTEILALKVLSQGFGSSINTTMVLGGAVALTIIYTTLGGYKGTFKTDVVQTLFLIFALAAIIIFGMAKVGRTGNLTLAPFMKKGLGNSIVVLLSYSAIGIGSLITGLDIWARMRASEGDNMQQGKQGLWWSLITLVPFLLVCGFGILFVSYGFTVENSEQQTFTTIIPQVASATGIPLGFLMILLIVVAISTADTSLITISQAIEPIVPNRFRTLGWFRAFAAIISTIGLFVALAIPISRTIQMFFCTISLPVALTPIVFIRRFKKSVHAAISVFAIVSSCILGLVIGLTDPDYASYSAAVILIAACLFYGLGILLVKMRQLLKGEANE